ncbi:MAG: RbsD/FucU domain-containing protein [Rhizomicrobium sp.]
MATRSWSPTPISPPRASPAASSAPTGSRRAPGRGHRLGPAVGRFRPRRGVPHAGVDEPDEIPLITGHFARALAAGGYHGPIEPIERFVFYERAKAAFAVVATGETRLYGNLILKKGVIRPGQN